MQILVEEVGPAAVHHDLVAAQLPAAAAGVGALVAVLAGVVPPRLPRPGPHLLHQVLVDQPLPLLRHAHLQQGECVNEFSQIFFHNSSLGMENQNKWEEDHMIFICLTLMFSCW